MINKLTVLVIFSLLLSFCVVAGNVTDGIQEGSSVDDDTPQTLSSDSNSTDDPSTPSTEENGSQTTQEEIVEEETVEGSASEEVISILPVEEPIEENLTKELLPEENITENPLENTTETPVEEIPAEEMEEPLIEENNTGLDNSLTGGVVGVPVVPIVEKIKTFITVVLNKISVFIGQIVKIRALLVDENQNPVPHQTIDFYLGAEKIGSEITNGKGEAAVFWDSSPTAAGVYAVKADYPGNEQYEGSFASAEVAVEESPKAEEEILLTPLALETQVQGAVTSLETCTTVNYEEEEYVYQNCTRLLEPVVCSDEPTNASCNTPAEETYECVTGTQVVQKSRDDCETFGYMLDNGVKNVKLTTTDYSCSTTEENGIVTVICDSKFDGNGDGICSSGESCQKFILEGGSFAKYEKNSQDEFTTEDDSYFAERASTEVLK